MKGKDVAYLWYWVIGPWITGIALIFTSGLIRSLHLAKRFADEWHFHLFGTYVVASQGLAVASLILLLLTTAVLAILLSRSLVGGHM
jgi:hypothetical protein